MHSDVNIYIACSGEFFVRRLAHSNEDTEAPSQKTHSNEDIPGGPPSAPPPKDPKHYELVIDNDSGTYRPKGSLLPLLQKFLSENFPGLHIVTKECTDEQLSKMKHEQRERKKKEGKDLDLVQNSDEDISSSDEEDLNKHSKREGRKKGGKERFFEAVEDPGRAVKETIAPGRVEREEREAEGDKIELGAQADA